MPQILEDKKNIEKYRKFLKTLPFEFMPYTHLKESDWNKLTEYSASQIGRYKSAIK